MKKNSLNIKQYYLSTYGWDLKVEFKTYWGTYIKHKYNRLISFENYLLRYFPEYRMIKHKDDPSWIIPYTIYDKH